MIEFPALVYRSASVHLLVHDKAEHAAALADGWFATVPEALAPKAETPREEMEREASAAADQRSHTHDSKVARAEMEREAAALGLQYSPLIGDAKLAERIAAAKAKG